MAYVDDDGSSGSGDDVNMLDGHNKRQSVTPGGSGRGKRSRKATGDAIVDAMLEIAAASKMRAAAIMKNEDRFSISKCIKVLDEMQGVDQRIYFLALDLFENPNAREIFISLKSEKSHYERNRVIQDDFSESISRHFNNVLKESCHFHVNSYNHHLWSLLQIFCLLLLFIRNSIGVIDGMHVPAHLAAKDQSRFRNKKGVLSQNILAFCTFDLQFLFIYPGGEGSVADSRLSRAVLDDPDQNFRSIPEGYSNLEGFIAPYPEVRYRLHEFRGANRLPKNPQELFNHRHSSLGI
ncbi:hypothetical protein POTOM_017544 [Populus tomentosa]|uniref:DDE Tnp4 domain-containing protein n=1 Tax=Populus tomentosa TaxID=118781 RepID=A0A8X8AAY3_POPTO|nr:hypothetical protein POTOM_017544 [Populus tomentosa]